MRHGWDMEDTSAREPHDPTQGKAEHGLGSGSLSSHRLSIPRVHWTVSSKQKLELDNTDLKDQYEP